MLKEISIPTKNHSQMIDITRTVQTVVTETGVTTGVCHVFIPHTTAGLTINENADPTVVSDFLRETEKIVPWNDGYQHVEGNSAAHIKASLMGFSQTVFIENGKMLLGTWQSIYFCEFDGPRTRKMLIKVTAG